MEILHYEVVNNHTSALILYIVYSILSIGLGIVIYRNNKDWKFGLIVSLFFVGMMTFAYTAEDKSQYEYQKVKVSDWNIVHNERWEVVNQEGDIVELKRKIEEE